MDEFLILTAPPLAIAVLAAIACVLPGNFLVLSRRAMLGDAISHVVLPGIVAAFLLTGSASGWVMGAGALVAAGLSALLIELVIRRGGLEPGAAMAVVFTTLFAAGVLLLEVSGSGNAHLDVEHALYGNLETLIWLSHPPPELARLAGIAAVIIAALVIFWRPLVITTFDPIFARGQGIRTGLIQAGLTAATALASVAAFQAVGSILTIAMLICPAAAARLVTRSLGVQIAASLGFAIFAAVAGFLLAGDLPLWLGLPYTLSTSGMIATVSGLSLAVALAASHRARARL